MYSVSQWCHQETPYREASYDIEDKYQIKAMQSNSSINIADKYTPIANHLYRLKFKVFSASVNKTYHIASLYIDSLL